MAWGWPVWDAEASWLEKQIHHSQPDSVKGDFGTYDEGDGGPTYPDKEVNVRFNAHEKHTLAGGLALFTVAIGLAFAYLIYYRKAMNPADAVEQFPGVYRFLQNKWYFDEVYTRPARSARPGRGWMGPLVRRQRD